MNDPEEKPSQDSMELNSIADINSGNKESADTDDHEMTELLQDEVGSPINTVQMDHVSNDDIGQVIEDSDRANPSMKEPLDIDDDIISVPMSDSENDDISVTSSKSGNDEDDISDVMSDERNSDGSENENVDGSEPEDLENDVSSDHEDQENVTRNDQDEPESNAEIIDTEAQVYENSENLTSGENENSENQSRAIKRNKNTLRSHNEEEEIDEDDDESERSERIVRLPQSKIKKIMRTDGQMKVVAKDAVAAVTIATELFISLIAQQSYKLAASNKKKTVQLIHVKNLLPTSPLFDFLEGTLLEHDI